MYTDSKKLTTPNMRKFEILFWVFYFLQGSSAARISVRGGTLEGRPRGGYGVRGLSNMQKCIILAYFQKNSQTMLLFRVFGRKTQMDGNFEKFSKNFLRKLREIHYFSIFFKKFNKPCVNFSRVWTKNTLLGNFDNNSIIKLNF